MAWTGEYNKKCRCSCRRSAENEVPAMATLRDILEQNVREGDLYEKMDRGFVRCFACGHCCPIPDGQAGVCKVRFNRGGKLLVPWQYVGGVQCDPIEKKPFFHAYPGSLAYSFGMLGCDLHCSYCQNWVTSQAIRDPNAVSPPLNATPEDLVRDALHQGAKVLVSTYNEPLITSEWAVAVFKEARAAGLQTGFVSNGNGTPQVLEYLRPWVDLYKVDLKSFDDRHYRQLGGRIEPILKTIRSLFDLGFWVEIVTLVIPGFNDSDGELTRLAEFLVSVSPDIPWHVTAFHKDYKMTDPENTSAATLLRAAETGKRAGLRFVYAGNLPSRVGDLENTRCPECHELLIERYGYHILQYKITSKGKCPSCGAAIPGRWAAEFQGQITDHPYLPRLRHKPNQTRASSARGADPGACG
jgi:pyruvate formate lyase activating enzyme